MTRAGWVTLLGLAAGCESAWIDPMERQPRVRAYQESAVFSDGRGMRRPPAGTVAREAVIGADELAWRTTDGGVPLGATRIPLPVSRALVERGRERFEIVCATCHGLLGNGESVVASKMAERPPPSLHEERIRRSPPGWIFRVVSDGFGLMPPYRGELSVEDRWAVVAYLRALQISQDVRVDTLAPDERRKVEAAP